MTQALIKLGMETFGRSAAGLVYGQISLSVGDTYFPHPQWSDFIVVVLTWWCHALLRVVRGEREKIEVRLMEGPYLVELQVTRQGFIHIGLVEAGLHRRKTLSAEVEIGPLISSVLESADQAIKACEEHGWWSRDADELAAAAAQLRRGLEKAVY